MACVYTAGYNIDQISLEPLIAPLELYVLCSGSRGLYRRYILGNISGL